MAIQGWKIDSTRMGDSSTWLEKRFYRDGIPEYGDGRCIYEIGNRKYLNRKSLPGDEMLLPGVGMVGIQGWEVVNRE